MGDGQHSNAIGIGIVLIKFADLPVIFPLYPCYHMPQNPQQSFSNTAMKQYLNNVSSVRYEALDWIRITTDNNKSARLTTIQKYKDKEIQDYIYIDIMTTNIGTKESTEQQLTVNNMPQLSFIPPQLNHSFIKNDNPDWTIIHRRMDHTKDYLIEQMCKEKTMEGLPDRYKPKLQKYKERCPICAQATLDNVPWGITLNTDNLQLGQLIHMDFYFMNITSIRKFTSVLMAIDAKARKLWKFPTQSKRPPLDIIDFFLTQMKRNGRPVQFIRTDLGGELAKSSEVCSLLVNKHQCGIQTTAEYSSWLNGKVERQSGPQET